MRYILRGLRGLSSMMMLGILAYVAVGAAQERVKREALPTRIGEVREERSYWQDVQSFATDAWLDFYIAYLPGVVPEPIKVQRQDPSSLDALKSRTRTLSQEPVEDGISTQLNF